MLKTYHRICFQILLSLPGIIFGFLWAGQNLTDYRSKLTLVFIICVWCVIWSFILNRAEDRPLKTLSNLLSSLREGDYSIQARTASSKTALKEVFLELNSLIGQMRHHRLGNMEANTLLGKILDEMDVVVMAFDSKEILHWVNPAAAALLVDSEQNLVGKNAKELQVEQLISGPETNTMELRFGGRLGRWGVRRRSFRERGKLYQVVVLNDLSRALREEERLAWKRLIRVMSHEINNSLTPIVSIANTLESMLSQITIPNSSEADFKKGLEIVRSRAVTLRHFLDGYGKLARLPEPCLKTTPITPLICKCAELESRMHVSVEIGPSISVDIDPNQFEQLLINLICNAVDSCQTRCEDQIADAPQPYLPKVTCGWNVIKNYVTIYVRDNGLGLPSSSNHFVPFFTTKPNGSGIGLALCRQIAEGHNAQIQIENNSPESGCFASIKLPATSLRPVSP